jgi:FixJ family two-component response regulator
MSTAMDVASGITLSRLQKVSQQAQNGLLGDLLDFPMPHLNEVIIGLDFGDDFREPKPSSVAVLLLTGTLDVRTYVEGQKQAVAHFNNLTHVHVIKAEHNLFTSSP